MLSVDAKPRWALLGALVVVHLLTGVGQLVFAYTVWALFSVWLVTAGILIGAALSGARSRTPLVAASIGIISIWVAMVLRALPIWSLNWTGATEVEITRGGHDWKITITDPAELRRFEEFGRRGSYRDMLKSGYGYHIYVGWADAHGAEYRGFYVHGGGLGPSPGGFSQAVFVPARPGFRLFFEDLLAKYGHPVGEASRD